MTAARFLAFLPALSLMLCLPAPNATRGEEPGTTITNSIGMKLAAIPKGKFMMGSPANEAERNEDELQHEVTITRPYYMGVYPVTQGQIDKVMGTNPSFFHPRYKKNPGSLDHPVDQVLFGDAHAFCKKLSELPEEKKAGRVYRLPTEAEWEYACRAGTTTPFNLGKSLSSKQANFNGNHPYGGADKGPYLSQPSKAGSYPANAWGLHDMHGNIWQWCADWYDPDYYKNSPKEDPRGPAKGVVETGFTGEFFPVLRGGCWQDEAAACRSANRFRLQPSQRYRWVGFRVACDVAAK
jgi:formylglycine-generating enzyme